MNAESQRRTIIVIVIFLIFLVIGYIYVFDPGDYERHLPVGISDFRDRSFYEIDTMAILESINQGETEVFTPSAIEQQTPLEESVLWQQADFVEVARTLNLFVWKEPLSGWRLYSMHFSTPCKDNLNGFTEGDFYYFKTAFRENGKIRYSAQNFFISPEFGEVTWAGGANFARPLLGWENIRLSEIQINAEDALAIAEANAGRETRELVDNRCRVHVRLGSDKTWQVEIYQSDTGSSLFRVVINSVSGKIE